MNRQKHSAEMWSLLNWYVTKGIFKIIIIDVLLCSMTATHRSHGNRDLSVVMKEWRCLHHIMWPPERKFTKVIGYKAKTISLLFMSYVGAENDPNTQFLVETSKQQNKCLSFGLWRYLSVHIAYFLGDIVHLLLNIIELNGPPPPTIRCCGSYFLTEQHPPTAFLIPAMRGSWKGDRM